MFKVWNTLIHVIPSRKYNHADNLYCLPYFSKNRRRTRLMSYLIRIWKNSNYSSSQIFCGWNVRMLRSSNTVTLKFAAKSDFLPVKTKTQRRNFRTYTKSLKTTSWQTVDASAGLPIYRSFCWPLTDRMFNQLPDRIIDGLQKIKV